MFARCALVSRHSGNSGKPPSSDTNSQHQVQNQARQSRAEQPRAAREQAKKLTGSPEAEAQAGQATGPGVTSRQVSDPDTVVVHTPDCCDGCGGALGDAGVTDVDVNQVFDLLPEPWR